MQLRSIRSADALAPTLHVLRYLVGLNIWSDRWLTIQCPKVVGYRKHDSIPTPIVRITDRVDDQPLRCK